MTEQTQSAFTLTRQDNGIAILTMDVPGESMNTLKAAFGEEMTVLLDEIENVLLLNFLKILMKEIFLILQTKS